MDRAIAAGVKYLLGAQTKDGAWPAAGRYGGRGGLGDEHEQALQARIVPAAIVLLKHCDSAGSARAVQRGLRFLRDRIDKKLDNRLRAQLAEHGDTEGAMYFALACLGEKDFGKEAVLEFASRQERGVPSQLDALALRAAEMTGYFRVVDREMTRSLKALEQSCLQPDGSWLQPEPDRDRGLHLRWTADSISTYAMIHLVFRETPRKDLMALPFVRAGLAALKKQMPCDVEAYVSTAAATARHTQGWWVCWGLPQLTQSVEMVATALDLPLDSWYPWTVQSVLAAQRPDGGWGAGAEPSTYPTIGALWTLSRASKLLFPSGPVTESRD